ncbi:MAG TPA: hypothetical protein PKY30_26720 [Myxococcota bacterium]|nr:hypothetical protein [Myxococcota bacterium]HNH50656.1 hypothetical protein [Myxococcota bacterium]
MSILHIDRVSITTSAPPERVRAVLTGALRRLAQRRLPGQSLRLRSVVLEEEDLLGEGAEVHLADRLERWLKWEAGL